MASIVSTHGVNIDYIISKPVVGVVYDTGKRARTIQECNLSRKSWLGWLAMITVELCV